MSHTYDNDLLKTVTTPSTTYTFNYGAFSLASNVKIGSRILAEYTYTDDQNFYLERLDYGNDDFVQYEYDDKGRILSATYEDTKTVEYTYDNSGRTATISDEASGTVSSFGYDYMDRVSVYTEENPDNKLTLSYSYYVANKKLKTLLEEINGHPRGASYVYDNDERLKSYQKANGKREYTYDDFDRVPSYVTQHKNTGDTFDTVLTTAFTFASSAVSTTSGRIASMTQTGNGFSQNYSYTYDKNGNILSVTDPNGTTTYEYDSLGQLLRENNQAGNFTHVWEYDNAGNIESRTEYAYTTGELGTPINTVDYSYDDAEWGDLLTKYGDLEIAYDEIGNPESIGTSNLTWQHGRQLASVSDGETTWHYTYNADGLRTKRTDGTNTYEYVYYNGLLQYMEYNNTPVYFTHAPDGTPMGMLTDGRAYFYIINLQGDVVGIVDATGNLVVSYTYDAWGNILSCTGSMANTLGSLNPIRYRGYVYDAEVGMYYLQSRYYNPSIGRFINSDSYTSTGQGILGYNMFAYCNNNPVMYSDPEGEAGLFLAFIASTVVAGVANAISTAIGGGSVEECLVSGLIGAGAAAVGFGVALATGFSPVGNVAARAVSSTICDLGTAWYRNGKITGQDVALTAVDVTIDACFSTITYYYTDPIKDFATQTLVNSSIDAGVDVMEAQVFSSGTHQQPSVTNSKKNESYRFVVPTGGRLHELQVAKC